MSAFHVSQPERRVSGAHDFPTRTTDINGCQRSGVDWIGRKDRNRGGDGQLGNGYGATAARDLVFAFRQPLNTPRKQAEVFNEDLSGFARSAKR